MARPKVSSLRRRTFRSRFLWHGRRPATTTRTPGPKPLCTSPTGNSERKPFDQTDDPRRSTAGESHQGRQPKLRYVVENRRGGAVLAGAAGTGKTLLARLFARQKPETCRPIAHLVFPQMSAAELLSYLAEELGAPPAAGRGIDQTIRRIQQFLAENE